MTYPSLACNLDHQLLSTALPLLEAGTVSGLEWSYDAVYQYETLPEWFAALLKAFAAEGRLIGHGIFYSVCSGAWSEDQRNYLDRLAHTVEAFPFDHVTEHFGFLTGANFHRGAPIAPPLTQSTLRIGQDRLHRLHDAARCPVGLENLAFAYSADDVFRQYAFLDQLVQPIDGLLILDLHNLYCQLHNFSLDLEELLRHIPLERVREMHLSGGSWDFHHDAPTGRVRRDTHDERVPDEVFHLLHEIAPRCSNLKFVVLEQLGSALRETEAQLGFQADFDRMTSVCTAMVQQPVNDRPAPCLPNTSPITHPPLQDRALANEQQELSTILETSSTLAEVQDRLSNSSLANSAWQMENWSPYMLETAWKIARKWR
ncbi:uncharacterized protein DUF692 [Neolewinella xylanilytica]|uniref:Uncharacterized protein DUF692 n=1 Tax=Neolewinella xylanilytica TaxID=1514080 RepID=A0A2S6I602_9BACT|nr:DUF692 family multinuclear iron-containing protein [Neolewinella xylanilytica]PPK86585.1 uncharacterized protein DUF692 [Neolewinella xylanilytica]